MTVMPTAMRRRRSKRSRGAPSRGTMGKRKEQSAADSAQVRVVVDVNALADHIGAEGDSAADDQIDDRKIDHGAAQLLDFFGGHG